ANGAFRLILTPKPIDTDEEGNAVFAGLPYGPKSRLILMYLQSYAVRHRTKTIVLGDSMTEWIRRLGFENPSGGERGVITAINEQARRISRCD
ncbi:replication protein RepA, partial [Acinetobacter baumannii]